MADILDAAQTSSPLPGSASPVSPTVPPLNTKHMLKEEGVLPPPPPMPATTAADNIAPIVSPPNIPTPPIRGSSVSPISPIKESITPKIPAEENVRPVIVPATQKEPKVKIVTPLPADDKTSSVMESVLNLSEPSVSPVPLKPEPQEMSATPSPPLPDQPKPRRSSKVPIIGTVIAILLVSIAGSVYYLSQQQKQVAQAPALAGGPCSVNKGSETETYCDNEIQKRHTCSGGTCSDNPNRTCGTWTNESNIGTCGGGSSSSSSSSGGGSSSGSSSSSSSSSSSGGGQCPSNVNCNDCGGFNQGQCINQSSCCGSACESGLSPCGGGCYPSGYKTCPGQAGCFQSNYTCGTDPCAGITCPSGQFCSHGICAAQPTGQGNQVTVSFGCSRCTADRRCDTGAGENNSGYGNPCGQVDLCQKKNGNIDFSTCQAVKLCDASCSGTTPTQPPPPPPPPPSAPKCTDIRILKAEHEVEPSTLKAGDQVTIAIKGNNATKGHARINGGAWVESSTLNASGEYTVPFTVPGKTYTFTIEAEVFKNGSWQ